MDEKKDCLFQLRNRPFFARGVIINSQVKEPAFKYSTLVEFKLLQKSTFPLMSKSEKRSTLLNINMKGHYSMKPGLSDSE
jgi:hypothetical protein